MISIYKKSQGNNDAKFNQIAETLPNSWLDITNADSNDFREVLKLCPNLVLEDIDDVLDESEIPRIEKHDDTIVVILRVPERLVGDKNIFTKTFTIIISPQYFISISPIDTELKKSVFKSNQIYTSQRAKLLISFLSVISEDYIFNIRDYTKKFRQQKLSLESVSAKDVGKLIEVEEVLTEYKSILIPLKSICEKINSGSYIQIHEEDMDLLDDMKNNIDQATVSCGSILEGIKSLRDSYQIVFTNALTKKINLLTALTLIITIPNVITSFYGMNVPLPMQYHPYMSLIILGISLLAISIFIIFVIRRIIG